MIEVEIKLPLFRRSITERALTDCGFKAGNLVKESDFYFTSDFHDFLKTDVALRIRTCENFTTRETTSFPIRVQSSTPFPQQERNWKPVSKMLTLQGRFLSPLATKSYTQ